MISHVFSFSFQDWLSIARDTLKWNDYCINLFWDLLLLALIYLNPENAVSNKKDDVSVDLECLTIFLVLHIIDQTQQKPSTPANYDSVWPTAGDGELYPTSPVASSPASPVKEGSRAARASASSPLSPRSPRHTATIAQPASPKRNANVSNPRTPRSSTQYLHSVRQKVPIILQILSSQFGSGGYDEISDQSEFLVCKRSVDALGLIVCGGYSRDQTVTPLSGLYSAWSSGDDSNSYKISQDIEHMDSGLTVNSNEFISWINVHLSMNDLIYPISLSPNFGNISSPPMKDCNSLSADYEVNKDSRIPQPSRTINSFASLSRYSPTLVCASNTTVLHIVGVASSRSSSFRRIGSRSYDMFASANTGMIAADAKLFHSSKPTLSTIPNNTTDALDIVEVETNDFGITADYVVESENTSSPNSPSHFQQRVAKQKLLTEFDDGEISKLDLGLDLRFKDMFLHESASAQNVCSPNAAASAAAVTANRPDLTLPQLFINYCNKSHLYMISPYYSASIVGCSHCEIVIGAVFGAIIVNGCDKLKISGACRKLIIVNCSDCEFSIATLSPTIIEGDCRNIKVGPHNTMYRNMRHHLKVAELLPLLDEFRSHSVQNAGDGFVNNQWSKICDITACLEATNLKLPHSLTSGFLESSSYSDSLPHYPSSTVQLLPPHEFRVIHVPVKTEYISFDVRLYI